MADAGKTTAEGFLRSLGQCDKQRGRTLGSWRHNEPEPAYSMPEGQTLSGRQRRCHASRGAQEGGGGVADNSPSVTS